MPPADETALPASSRGRADRFFVRLTRAQIERPWMFLLVAAITVALSGWLASGLELKTALGELLPRNKQSVIVADRVGQRLPSESTLSVLIEGSDDEALMAFVDDLAVELEAIDPAMVARVDTGARSARAFFEENRFLYADLKTIQEVHAQIQERWDYEVNKDQWLDDPPPPITEESLRARLQTTGAADAEQKAAERFPDYYLDRDKHHIAVLVRTHVSGGDLERAKRLEQLVRDAVAKVEEARGKVGTVSLGGNLLTSAETYQQVKSDLAHVGKWGVALILGVVFLFYLRLRTLLAMALTVGIGATWTFGLAELLIGHLNSSTGFLFSIIVGNGINFGIIYMARYMEARRDASVHDSALLAHRDTWLATLTAAGAATCAYGSLMVTDFRGFEHFGVIGGTGMLLCWLATYLFMPPIVAVTERVLPIGPGAGWVQRLRGLYGLPFAMLASRLPRGTLVAGAVATAAAAVLAYPYVRDPIEYNMRNIANAPQERPTEASVAGGKVDAIVGRQGQDGLAIATDRLDQVLPLKAELDKRREAAPEGQRPFDEVVTIHSVLPTQQAEKLALINDALTTLHNARDKRFLDDAQWQKLEKLLPKQRTLSTIDIDDLPEYVTRSFTEKDGTIGRLVYIVPTRGRSVWDGRYLIEFADGFRETPLPDGSVVHGSGAQVIYADVLLAIGEDAPKAIVVSLVSTLLIVLLAFRAGRAGLLVVASVAVGFLWLLGILAVWKTDWAAWGTDAFQVEALKLNFLNFVALPITIGVGADYAVNVMQRYERVDADEMRRVVVETGGAVVLCSLTTILGYFALTLSINRAIQSFGVAAAAGEICCLLTGVLVLPAWLIHRASRRV